MENDNNQLCEHCLVEIIMPKLREDDINILQYLYNEDITLPQVAQHMSTISNEIKISPFKTQMGLFRLQCYNMVGLQPWSKSNNYFLKNDGIKALQILLKQMGG
ncbi:MAG: helix-turn-helix domain-containing protein [archaeon]